MEPIELQGYSNLGNGDHFLTLLRKETSRLDALVASAERELNEDDDTVPEDVRGKMRIGVGKAKMLMKRKFVQFETLCFKNLGVDCDIRYSVTSEDLAGYWDTIVIQLLQVYKIFEEIENLKKNNWKEPINPTHKKKIIPKKMEDKTSAPAPTTTSN